MPDLTKEHKEALAKGRRQAKAVRDYLDALGGDQGRGAPGRPSDPDAVREKIADYEKRIEQEEDPLRRLELIQKRLDSERHLADLVAGPDPEELQSDFIEVAHEYSERKGITYSAWRELGVPASVLKEAGIPRTRRVSA